MKLSKEKLKSLTNSERLVIEFIERASKENPVGLKALAQMTDLSEIQVKRIIRNLRFEFPIISVCNENQNGYFLSSNKSDIERFIAEKTAYIRTLQSTVDNMRQFIK